VRADQITLRPAFSSDFGIDRYEGIGDTNNMRQILTACALLVTTVTVTLAAPAAVPGKGEGWTGVTKPKDIIVARLELMEHIEELMEPIDTITVKDTDDLALLRHNGEVIGAMLTALPHLFPPTTNLYDPKAAEPQTLALPPIWKNFDNFYTLAGAAAKAAEDLSLTEGKAEMKTASLKLRASCDACHTLFLRPYVPPKVLDSDLNFDFESALRKKP
jgi:cytochrome c556